MLLSERRARILELLRIKGSVTVTELSELLKVSDETIRRDLQQLERENMLNRVYGGAYLGNIVAQALPNKLRKESLKAEKESIAKICSGMVENGNTIMLDSSTTSFYIAKRIVNYKNLIVITNSLDIAYILATAESVKVICSGGNLDKQNMSFLDYNSLNNIKNYYADISFVSCTGISMESGLTDSNEMQGKIRNAMLQHSQKKICVADNTKLGKTTLSQIVPLSEIDCLVTDKMPSQKWVSELKELSIDCLF